MTLRWLLFVSSMGAALWYGLQGVIEAERLFVAFSWISAVVLFCAAWAGGRLAKPPVIPVQIVASIYFGFCVTLIAAGWWMSALAWFVLMGCVLEIHGQRDKG